MTETTTDLSELKRPELLKLAKEYGVPGSGTNDELRKAIGAAAEERAERVAAADSAEPAEVPAAGGDEQAQPEAAAVDGAEASAPDSPVEEHDGSPNGTAASALEEAESAAGDGDGQEPESAAGDGGGEASASETCLPIVRENETSWWCPNCDHSMLHGIERCPNCGAERVGDEVWI